MKVADLEKFLLALPATTLSVQWGHDRVFKVGGKMFSVISFSDKTTPAGLSFKASEDSFRLLTELPGITPAPYLARAQWVRLDKPARLKAIELKAYLTRAHSIVSSGLTRKLQRELGLIP
jgi:predicted DNA-binding protein (MmcQ/YjbR family)